MLLISNIRFKYKNYFRKNYTVTEVNQNNGLALLSDNSRLEVSAQNLRIILAQIIKVASYQHIQELAALLTRNMFGKMQGPGILSLMSL